MSKLDERNSIEQIYFYNCALIDTIIKSYHLTDKQKVFLQDEQNCIKTIQHLFDFIELNEWMRSSSKTNLNRVKTDEDLSMSAANSLINIKLIIRLCFFDAENRKFTVSKIKDSNVKQECLSLLRYEEFMQSLAYFMSDFNHDDVIKLMAYETMFDLNEISAQRSEFSYQFSLENYLRLSQAFKQDHSSDPAPPAKINFSAGSHTSTSRDSFCPQQQFSLQKPQPNAKETNSDLNKLFDFYDYKLNEQKAQETQMVNLLNQYFSNSLLKEVEFKNLRDQIRIYAQKELEYKNELTQIEKKKLEYESKHKELINSYAKLKESFAEASNKNQTLEEENKNLIEQCTKSKQSYEQLEKDNEEIVESLQKALASEAASKKELQIKIKELNHKLNDMEQQKQAVELKKKEIETELETCKTDLSAKSDECEKKSGELDTCRADLEKLKSILSYVKENYK